MTSIPKVSVYAKCDNPEARIQYHRPGFCTAAVQAKPLSCSEASSGGAAASPGAWLICWGGGKGALLIETVRDASYRSLAGRL